MPGYLAALEQADLDYESIPTYHPTARGGRCWWFLAALLKILYIIRKAKKSGNTPIVYSHAGAGLSLFREGIVLFVSKIVGAETVLQIHTPESTGYLKSSVKKLLFKLSMIGADKLCLLTPWWKEFYIKSEIKKSIAVIPNPLPREWEYKAKESIVVTKSNEKKRMCVLVMSRMENGKGVDLVIEAASHLPDDIKIIIAGDGSLLEDSKNRVRELSIEHKVEFAGWVSGQEKQRLIDNADILCHPTQMDAMPMNILEAMANGIPIVALDWGPIGDLVPGGKAGILVGNPDPLLIAEAIIKLQNSQVRFEMGNYGKRWVLENYSSEKVGKDLQHIFKELVN